MEKRSPASRKSAPAAVKRKSPRNKQTGAKPEATAPAVAVTAEQRRHLSEDIAYFQAKHYRAVEPGGFREEDRRAAEAKIESLLEKKRK